MFVCFLRMKDAFFMIAAAKQRRFLFVGVGMVRLENDETKQRIDQRCQDGKCQKVFSFHFMVDVLVSNDASSFDRVSWKMV